MVYSGTEVRLELEFGVPVWNSSLTRKETDDMERVQKIFIQILLNCKNIKYLVALKMLNLETLEIRSSQLHKNF